MLADIAQGSGSEQSIDNGMDHDIGVGVTGETAFKGDGDASQDERAIGGEGVYVVAGTDAYRHSVPDPLMSASAISTSSCVVILILA